MGGFFRRLSGVALLGVAIVGMMCGSVASAATDHGGRTRDCTTEARLLRDQPSVVRYIVWCGVQGGRVTLRIRRPKGPPILGFSRFANPKGPGSSGPLRCHPQAGARVFCAGKKRGPVTFRGTIRIAPRTRCAAPIRLNVWRWTGDSLDFPSGCLKSHRDQVRPLRQIIRSRAEEGLDLDLAADRAAIVRRAKELQRAWKRGEPVARWTSEEEVFGMPLRAAEQIEMEYRDTYREQFQRLVEDSPWVAENAASSYAGYEIDFAAGGIIYVGFTAEPEAMLEKLRRRLIAPDRFLPFPVTPTHTEKELEELWFDFPPRTSPLWGLVNETHIDYLANKVAVGTQHVARVRRLIATEYGPDAPFKVFFARPIELL